MDSNSNFNKNKETKIETNGKLFASEEEEKHPGFVVTG